MKKFRFVFHVSGGLIVDEALENLSDNIIHCRGLEELKVSFLCGNLSRESILYLSKAMSEMKFLKTLFVKSDLLVGNRRMNNDMLMEMAKNF